MKFWVDYEATILIEAKNKDEAEEIFYQCYSDNTRQYVKVTNIDPYEENEAEE